MVAGEAVERVRFRMDVPMPVVPQPVLATGAAAALVHPATGYSVAASLRAAGLLADAIASGGGAGAAWRTLWPRHRIRARQLESFGLERVLTMDQATLRSFFQVFFSLPADDVAAYLSGNADPGRVAAVMWRTFVAAPLPLRVALSVGDLRSLLAWR